jgi:hypothetical protein
MNVLLVVHTPLRQGLLSTQQACQLEHGVLLQLSVKLFISYATEYTVSWGITLIRMVVKKYVAVRLGVIYDSPGYQ